VVIAFKPDTLLGPKTIQFLPVQLLAGQPVAKQLFPGLVESEICFSVNTNKGLLRPGTEIIDPHATEEPPATQPEETNTPEEPAGEEFAVAPGISGDVMLSTTPPDGLDCPAAGTELDAIGWVGYAKIFVRTDLDDAILTINYQKDATAALYTRQVEVMLDPFPGYAVTVDDPVDNTTYVELHMHVDYGPLGDLGDGPAEGVQLTPRCIPDCPTLLGTSSGGADDPIVTDAGGDVTLFFDPNDAGTGPWVWFVTLSGGIEQRMQPDLSY
jgi:hypothetical protein